ncbi:unnamed protein product, partial [Wuchereria bancrofti]
GLQEPYLLPVRNEKVGDDRKSLQDEEQYEVAPSELSDISRERGSNRHKLDSSATHQAFGYQQ